MYLITPKTNCCHYGYVKQIYHKSQKGALSAMRWSQISKQKNKKNTKKTQQMSRFLFITIV